MTVHPQAQAMLDLVAASGTPDLADANLPDIRAGYALLNSMGAGSAEPVAEIAEREVPGPGGGIPVRVYRPDGDAPLPMVVYFHGGGWTIGSVDAFDSVTRQVANAAGAIVVSVDYRLAPEHPYPAAVDDCWAATTWAVEHATELGGDGTRFAVMGDSAGGNLAAVIAQRSAREGGPQPALQVLVYPAVDAAMDTVSHRDNAKGYFLDRELMDWFYGCYTRAGGQVDDPAISPSRAPDLRGVAPAFVITAEYDPLRDEGEAYAAALRAAGVGATVHRFDGMIHGFFGLGALVDAGREAVDAAGAALRAAFDTL